MRKVVMLLCVVMIAATLAAGCGGGSGKDPNGGNEGFLPSQVVPVLAVESAGIVHPGSAHNVGPKWNFRVFLFGWALREDGPPAHNDAWMKDSRLVFVPNNPPSWDDSIQYLGQDPDGGIRYIAGTKTRTQTRIIGTVQPPVTYRGKTYPAPSVSIWISIDPDL